MNVPKVTTYPPTPEKCIGTGESRFKDAMSLAPMVSPETSPETIKTLSSPSFSATSNTFLLETDKHLLTSLKQPTCFSPFAFHMVLNNISSARNGSKWNWCVKRLQHIIKFEKQSKRTVVVIISNYLLQLLAVSF